MLVDYDINFDDKVDRAADNLIERGFETDVEEARQKARIVLLMGMKVDAEVEKASVEKRRNENG